MTYRNLHRLTLLLIYASAKKKSNIKKQGSSKASKRAGLSCDGSGQKLGCESKCSESLKRGVLKKCEGGASDSSSSLNLQAVAIVSKRSYGGHRIAEELNEYGQSCGRNKARRLMNLAGVSVRRKKKFKVTREQVQAAGPPRTCARKVVVVVPNRT